MAISYAEAVAIVHGTAQPRKDDGALGEESVPLADALGRRASQEVRSAVDTPMIDSSAMDGYAVSSALTASASTTKPCRLHVKATIAAGDPPLHLPCRVDEKGRVPCVEIMTGAPFPESSRGSDFDACVPWEHTGPLPMESDEGRVVEIVKPPKANQNRRFAGHDFRKGDVIVRTGDKIGLQHIMAVASVGVDTITVQKRLSATVMTTGCELQPVGSSTPDTAPQKIPDCNGPFLTAALRGLGAEVRSVGGVPDDIDELQARVLKAVSRDACDILITTGGVSAGKFDFVPQAVQNLGGSVHLHHIAMRPGHPVLLASIPCRQDKNLPREVAVFGLPGNPIAAAACYRFLVVPYVRALQGQPKERPQRGVAVPADDSSVLSEHPKQHMHDGNVVYRKDKLLDTFRHGQLRASGSNQEVRLSGEQSSAKLRPFGQANCWVHIPAGISEVRAGDVLDCYSL